LFVLFSTVESNRGKPKMNESRRKKSFFFFLFSFFFLSAFFLSVAFAFASPSAFSLHFKLA